MLSGVCYQIDISDLTSCLKGPIGHQKPDLEKGKSCTT